MGAAFTLCRPFCRDRYSGNERDTVSSGFDFQMPVQAAKSFSHARDSYAESVDCIRIAASQHPAAVVPDLKYQLISPSPNLHRRYVASRVTEHVGQSLLY